MTAPQHLRQRILEAGGRQLAEHGAAEFSVARIARELQVSTASPYRHFTDRDGLLVAVIAHAANALVNALTTAVEAAAPPPAAQLRAAAAAWVNHTRGSRIGLADFSRPEVDRADDPAHRDACQRPLELVRGLVSAATDTDAELLAGDVLAVLHGYGTMPASALTPPSTGDPAKAAARAVGRLLTAAHATRRRTSDQPPASDDQPALF